MKEHKTSRLGGGDERINERKETRGERREVKVKEDRVQIRN